MIIDFHTHSPKPGAIVNLPLNTIPGPDEPFIYSAGIHPWWLSQASPESWQILARAAAMPQVVAIGETGLDTLRDPAIDHQKKSFEKHIELSESLRKPLIIHCVKAHKPIIELHKFFHPATPWIIHGFRRNENIARELLDAGLYLSLGPVFNTQAAAAIPDDRLLIETDDSTADISQVAAAVAQARGLSLEAFTRQYNQTLSTLKLL